ncbi:MAG: hypothetical protein ACLFPP_00875 [Spirochaetaceae bacterium]
MSEVEEPRAEAIIAEIYRQFKELQEAGGTPRSVVMTMEQYRRIQRYHASLGETPAPAFDYISKYSVLGLPVLIDNSAELRVTENSPGIEEEGGRR